MSNETRNNKQFQDYMDQTFDEDWKTSLDPDLIELLKNCWNDAWKIQQLEIDELESKVQAYVERDAGASL